MDEGICNSEKGWVADNVSPVLEAFSEVHGAFKIFGVGKNRFQ